LRISEERLRLATPEAAHVLGDQKRLVPVLTNLLNNAAKYTPQGGNIHLRMEALDSHVIFSVADDGIDAAQMLAMYLQDTGHDVLLEHESKRALQRVRSEAPDVCLLDIGLPDIDGNELARLLRLQPETENSILIAVTGYGQEQDKITALTAGFDHYLVKPVDVRKLADLLADIGVSNRI
jgi:CheY-like chemotaxis protein